MDELSTKRSNAVLGAPAPLLPARASILMVDDQVARLLTYEAILAGLGVQCVRCTSGAEALQRLTHQEFAAILLDINMPLMDGFEVARRIRDEPGIEPTPIIFVTAEHAGELDSLRGYAVGAIDYVTVPVVPEVLRSKVAVLVELHQRRSELKALNKELAQKRAQAEQERAHALAEREALLRATFEHPTELMVLLEAERDARGAIADWVYRDANPNACAILDLARDNVIGRRLSELLPERAPRLIATCAEVLQSRSTLHYEASLRERDFFVTIFPFGRDAVVSSAVDISARKRTEAALRASEARQHAMLDNAPVGIAQSTPDSNLEYANKAFCHLLGYTLDELRGRNWRDITHPDDVQPETSLAQRVLAGELADYTLEKRLLRRDGSIVWVNMFATFVFDARRQPLQGVAVAIDVSAHKRALSELEQNRERLLLAQNATGLGTFDWDIPGNSIHWDPRVYEMWGVEPGTAVTFDTFAQGILGEDLPAVLAAIDGALQPNGDGTYHASFRVRNQRDGHVRWVECSGRVYFKGGRPLRMAGTALDVSARMRAQEQRRLSEERLSELANNIDQFAWTCDAQGSRTWFNKRWYEYTGSTFEQMRGDGWHAVHDPAHLPRVVENQRNAFARGETWEDTFPLRAKDGSYRWFLARAVPIRDADGRVLRWLGTNTDITAQRELQQALEQADRRKDEFLAMLAHELRNPVAPIASAAEVLAQLIGDGTARNLVGIVQRQAGQLARLLDDLLDVARVTQDRIALRTETLSLQACVELALETAQPLLAARAHRLTIDLPSEPLPIAADRIRIAQCIGNLLSNAAKYTEPRGHITLRAWRDGGEVALAVTDDGIGIAPDFLAHVFELFAQGARGLDRAQGGLGIGLCVCKRLIDMHGGRIAAHSAGTGQGSTFTLHLPLATDPPAAPPAPIAAPASARRVLIVDDNDDAAHSLALLLEIEGHRTLTVNSGEGALAEAPAFAPQLVLLDIGLPDISGYDVAQRLRAAMPHVRLIAVSGYGQASDRARSAAAGFDAHLVKPLELDALKAALAETP